ncbi:MAG TPA: response regulator [Myxococcota bacterium]|nr:response regulator [Myxococcota bacterium]
MANNLPGGMVYQVDTGPDGRSRRLTYFSRGIETLHEIPLSELTEDSKRIEDSSFVYEAIDLEYRQMVAEAEARSVASMTPFSVDVPVTLPSGKKGWRHFTSAPRRMPDGRLIWDGLEIDITARKQAEEDRARLQEQLLQTQKIESIGQLAGGIAHDFNNMLSVILGHSEMALGRLALEGIDSDNPIFVHLKNILSAAERSAELTRQLLTFARKQPSRPRDIDLNARVSTLHPMLLQLIGEGIELVWTPSEEVGHVNIDPSQLDQILVNLCVNARDAIGDGGRIRIKTGIAAFDGEFCSRNPGHLPGDFAVLTVSDTGCGMDQQTVARLFEPFFTTKEVGRGTGLGLATVYGIVSQNQGFIRVFSKPDVGTVFRVYLPWRPGPQESRTPAKVPPPIECLARTILLVEDEPLIRHIASEMLESLGYDVIPAATPSDAMVLAEEYTGRIDLLMTDLVMPGMNGRSLAHNIKSLHPEARLLFMSGYTADFVVQNGEIEAGSSFLPKPFTLEDLMVKINEAFAKGCGGAPDFPA